MTKAGLVDRILERLIALDKEFDDSTDDSAWWFTDKLLVAMADIMKMQQEEEAK